MIKKGELIYKKIVNLKNKKQGYVEDICIDCICFKVIGLKVSSSSPIKKFNFLKSEDILSIKEVICAENFTKAKGVMFSSLVNLEVFDCTDRVIGEVEDIIIDERNYFIKAVIVGTGIINKLVNGRRVLLIEDLFFMENKIIYRGKDEIKIINMPCMKYI